MVETRRSVLTGAAAAAAVATAGQLSATWPSRAAAPPAGKQAPGFYRHKVGDYELTQISDGGTTFPLTDGFVTNADKAAVNAALEAAYMPKDQMTIIFNPMVVNTGSNLILIDTGYGAVGPKTAGQLQANMAASGIDPKAIDIVVISHLHPDHINGLVGADGGIAFPNAEIKMPAPDVAFWMDDGIMSRAPEGRLLDYFKNVRRVMGVVSSKVTKYEWDKEVASGITAFATVGHTPGHTSFVIA
jgi:glyoxylase-like metal-dependent hydrolase (beta-lactamase superfamily II)